MIQHYSLHGSFDWNIVNAETLAVEASGSKNNLILNQGIDYCFQRSFVENMYACALSPLYLAPLKTDTYLPGEFVRTATTETNADNKTKTVITSGNAGGGYSYPAQTITFTKSFKFPTVDVRTQVGTIGISYSAMSGQNLFSKSLIGPSPISIEVGQYLRLNYSLAITFPSSYNAAIPISNSGYSPLGYLGYFGPSNVLVDASILPLSGSWNSSGWSSSQLIGLMAINTDGSITPYSESRVGAVNMVTGFVTGMNAGNWILSGVLGTPSGYFSGQACNEPASGAFIFLSKNGQSPNITTCSIDRTAQNSINRGAALTYLGNGLGIKSATFSRGTAITGVYSWGIGGAIQPEKNCGFVYVSTGAAYTGGYLVTGFPSNGFPGFTKLSTGELTLNFYYAVSSS